MIWTPITIDELNELILSQLPEVGGPHYRLWTMIRILPEKWAESEQGKEGGGFWAVALVGSNVIWYNDIEDGFNISPFTQFGTIDEYGDEQYEIRHIMVQIIDYITKGTLGRWW